jgi:hypothetical protein
MAGRYGTDIQKGHFSSLPDLPTLPPGTTPPHDDSDLVPLFPLDLPSVPRLCLPWLYLQRHVCDHMSGRPSISPTLFSPFPAPPPAHPLESPPSAVPYPLLPDFASTPSSPSSTAAHISQATSHPARSPPRAPHLPPPPPPNPPPTHPSLNRHVLRGDRGGTPFAPVCRHHPPP